MVYQWKTASYIKTDANIAGKQCEELEKTVGLTPENLLNANRNEDAPLHNEFEWDDQKAAEQHRLYQARHIINCLCIKPESSQKEKVNSIRAFVKTTLESPYQSLNVILQSKDSYDAMLARAKKELESFISKYQTLAELKPVFEAYKEVESS